MILSGFTQMTLQAAYRRDYNWGANFGEQVAYYPTPFLNILNIETIYSIRNFEPTAAMVVHRKRPRKYVFNIQCSTLSALPYYYFFSKTLICLNATYTTYQGREHLTS